jgi:hypothetical protein
MTMKDSLALFIFNVAKNLAFAALIGVCVERGEYGQAAAVIAYVVLDCMGGIRDRL